MKKPTTNNMALNKKENSVFLRINPKIYSLDVIFTVCYIFLEDNYIILDGNKEKEVIVQIKPKQSNKDLERIAGDFFNQLATYSVYKNQLEQNSDIKNAIIQKVLLTNSTPRENPNGLEDIKLPWEEKTSSKK